MYGFSAPLSICDKKYKVLLTLQLFFHYAKQAGNRIRKSNYTITNTFYTTII